MQVLQRFTERLTTFLIWIAGFFLGVMVLLTCANIFFRFVWVPVKGSVELVGYFGAVTTAFALGYTLLEKGHTAVDLFTLKYSKRTQRIIGAINSLICMIFFGIVFYQIVNYATILFRTGQVSETLQIIYYPFTYAVAFGFAVLVLALLTEFLKNFLEEEDD